MRRRRATLLHRLVVEERAADPARRDLRLHPGDRAGRRRQQPGADPAAADRARRARPLSRAPSSGTSAWSIPTTAGRSTSRCERSSWATATWRNGAIKQALIVQALGLRKAMPDLFAKGSYEPVDGAGPAGRPRRRFRAATRGECSSGCGPAAADPSDGRRAGRYLFGITARAQVVQRIGRRSRLRSSCGTAAIVERLACGTFVHTSAVGAISQTGFAP